MWEIDWQNSICSSLWWYYSISALKNNIHSMKITPSALLQDPNPEAVVSDKLLIVLGMTHIMICRGVQCQQKHVWLLQEPECQPPDQELISWKRKKVNHLSTEWYREYELIINGLSLDDKRLHIQMHMYMNNTWLVCVYTHAAQCITWEKWYRICEILLLFSKTSTHKVTFSFW
jgi:hypothetical protein